MFRILKKDLRQEWSEYLEAGVIATCPLVELEFLYSARSLADRLERQRLLRDLFGWVPMNERAWERAAEVQQLLTEKGTHRSAGTARYRHLTPERANHSSGGHIGTDSARTMEG